MLALRSTGKRSWRSGYKVEFCLRCTVLNTLSRVQALSASLRWSADLQPDARVLCACNSRRPRAAGPPPDGALQRHDVFMGVHADVAALQQGLIDHACADGARAAAAVQLGTGTARRLEYSGALSARLPRWRPFDGPKGSRNRGEQHFSRAAG